MRRPLRDIRQPPPGAPIFSPPAGRVGCRHPVAPLLVCALPATFFVAQKALVLVQRTPLALLCHLPAQLTSGTLSPRLPTRASCHLRRAAPDDKPKLSPHCHREAAPPLAGLPAAARGRTLHSHRPRETGLRKAAFPSLVRRYGPARGVGASGGSGGTSDAFCGTAGSHGQSSCQCERCHRPRALASHVDPAGRGRCVGFYI